MARQTIAVLIAVAALLTTGGMVVAADTDAQLEEPTVNETQQADDAYVTDSGDVVLVYEEAQTANGSGYAGLNATEGLVYGLYEVSDFDSNVTGAFSMVADRSRMNGSGSLSAPRPESLQSLSFEMDSETSPSTSRSDADLDATISLPEDTMITALFSDATTSGEIRTSGTSMSTTGSADWNMTLPTMSAQSYDYDLRATDGGHVLEVSRQSQVGQRQASMWDTREKALQRLRSQFDGLTGSVGGSSEVTLDSYSFESAENEEGGQLDIEYTVEIEGLNELIRQSMVSGMSGPMTTESSSFGPNQDEIQRELSNLSIERASVSLDMDAGGGTANWNVSVDNYDGLVQGYFAAMEAQDDSGFLENQSERYEAQLEAMTAAEYASTASWDATVESTDGGSITADASFSQRSENWEAYVSEVEDRDLPPVGTQEFALNVFTQDDRVEANGSFLIEQEDLYNRSLANFERSLQAGQGTPPSVAETFETIRETGFRSARLDATFNETTARVEGGAAFENLTGISEWVDAPIGNATIEDAYVSQNASTSRGTLRLSGAVDSPDDESAVRELEMVSEDTTVHMPGDWDAASTSFESLDTDAVRDYLPNAESGEDGESDGMPTQLLAGGAGVLALLVVLVAVVLKSRS